jgi:hypothetical protein
MPLTKIEAMRFLKLEGKRMAFSLLLPISAFTGNCQEKLF